MHRVEETFDIEEKDRASAFGPQCTLNIVREGEPGIKGARESSSPKLGSGDEPMSVYVVEEAFRHTFFHKLAYAFYE